MLRTTLDDAVTHFELLPLVGAGPIKLGWTRDEVVALLGVPPKLRRPNSDLFTDIGVFAHYVEGRVAEVTLHAPAWPIFEGRSILECSIRDCLEQWGGCQLPNDPSMWVLPDLGLSAWAPLAKEDLDARCEVAGIFALGRYDQVLEARQ